MILLYFFHVQIVEPSGIDFIFKHDLEIILLCSSVQLFEQYLPKSDTFCKTILPWPHY